ncbi:MAG TPA: hypothetical protein VMK12_01760 [Anaeromyxobacteraceae bacterium]|nr:hypothetical protein [Anaeromyxobacteraceae bacterium]
MRDDLAATKAVATVGASMWRDALTVTEVEHQGKRFLLRGEARAQHSRAA